MVLKSLNGGFMRKANLEDLPKIFDMVWANISAFTIGEPNEIVTREYLKNIILGFDDGGIFINDDCTAAMGFTVQYCGYSMAKFAYGLFLVSDKPMAGIKLAKQVLNWVRSQGLHPIIHASPKLEKYYVRLGFKVRELGFMG